jgi:hypothetical protein
MWCKFDQILDDELQPVWIAVLLSGDVQIRLTVLRPTLPVMAFEAPGALGCSQPNGIVRRSDQQTGWEYAEAEGRAVAIQRLIGYECQRASAPFLDQSNINLADLYSEQPIVYESQASVAGRCLAAASLVRPAPFDPVKEFADIKVEIESPEMFHVHLPNGGLALVAPGETTPKHVSINGMEVEGGPMRYVHMTKDLNEVCGLGIAQLSGLASFDEPATFRLNRISENTIRLTTNSGVSLGDLWLRGDVRCVEALNLDNQWIDVTASCSPDSVPSQLVQEWSERNQRTLVDFRISV